MNKKIIMKEEFLLIKTIKLIKQMYQVDILSLDKPMKFLLKRKKKKKLQMN